MIVAEDYGLNEASEMIATAAALQKLLDAKTVKEKELNRVLQIPAADSK